MPKSSFFIAFREKMIKTWELDLTSPLQMTIACDSQFGGFDITDDQVWELCPGKCEPPAVALQTTFGLRANRMRLFPRFSNPNTTICDPSLFFNPLKIIACYPNYLTITFSPFQYVDIVEEIWVPDSHTITGRLTFTNNTDEIFALHVDWVALLNPIDGESMSPVFEKSQVLLKGKTGNLSPVCMLKGKAQESFSPFPSLAQDFTIRPATSDSMQWVLASLPQPEDSFQKASQVLEHPWDAELARIELANASRTIEISTGNPDWDIAFALSQKVAFNLLVDRHPPFPSFLLNRNPDQGYSHPKSSHGEFSFSPFDAYYLFNTTLAGKETFRHFIEHAVESQAPGTDDLRQYSNFRNQPILATLATAFEKDEEDHSWLQNIFPGLLDNFLDWFSPEQDHDQDKAPEYILTGQSALPDSPLYNIWQPEHLGMDISRLESPALVAFLHRECASLLKIARWLHREDSIELLREHQDQLQQTLDTFWNSKRKTYLYRDFLNHTSHEGKSLAVLSSGNPQKIKRSWKMPQRLHILLNFADEKTRALSIGLQGKNQKDIIEEKITLSKFAQRYGLAAYTTENCFTELEKVEMNGLLEGDTCSIHIPDLLQEDISLFLPLWAHSIPESKVKELVKHIESRSLHPFGIPAGMKNDKTTNPAVYYPWNMMIAEGLLSNGSSEIAAKIFTALMDGVIHGLKENHGFSEAVHCENGKSIGGLNHLYGLIPIRLFLQILGVQYRKHNSIILQGESPFPWPVTVKYRGIAVSRYHHHSTITFLDGQEVIVDGPGPHEVSF